MADSRRESSVGSSGKSTGSQKLQDRGHACEASNVAARTWLATAEHETGIAAVDLSTAMHFGVGTAAGLAGIDPKVALLIALVTEGALEAMKARDPHALFHRGVGESRINQIVDLLGIMIGAYVGQGMRTMIRHEAVATAAQPAVAPPPEAVPAAPVAPAGLGAYCRW
jgi:hypothetical protein